MIECQKSTCNSRYIGETNRSLKDRFLEHKGYIVTKKLNQATGYHFNKPGHSLNDFKIFIIEKIKNKVNIT